MQLTAVPSLKRRSSADAIVLPFWQGKKRAEPACDVKEFQSLIDGPLKAGDFHGKEGEILLLYAKGKEKRVVLLGLGHKKKCTAEALRRAYSAAAKVCLRKKSKSLNILVLEGDKALCLAICEGILLTNYRFDQLKSETLKDDPTVLLTKLSLIGIGQKELAVCKRGAQIVSAVNFARDLVNGNADDVDPQALAQCAKELEKEFSLIKTTVLDKKQIEKEKMGLILAVNRGALKEPRVIIMEYKGNPQSKDHTAIVGKGITYDTGGLNLKPTGGIETMKCDMAGAATVLGTLRAAAALKLKVNLIGIIASTENAIGPNSYKPGDVYRSMLGKTVEISNTDAEGRLVLADALTYAQQKFEPSRIIDLATLTGGVVVALGEEATGLFSNNDKLAEQLTQAGEVTFERLWRFPLYPEYKECLKSAIADLKNSGGRKASSITAAMFLQQFIKQVPWAHLDIAGTAYLSELKPYHPTHATGVGVRLLIEFLENLKT
jgi:leucyl aminopeptidase